MLVIFPFFITLVIGLIVAAVCFLLYFCLWMTQIFVWHAKVSKYSKEHLVYAFIPWLIGLLICIGTWVVSAVLVYFLAYFFMPAPNVHGDSIVFLMKLAMVMGLVPGGGMSLGCVFAGAADLFLIMVWMQKNSEYERIERLARS